MINVSIEYPIFISWCGVGTGRGSDLGASVWCLRELVAARPCVWSVLGGFGGCGGVSGGWGVVGISAAGGAWGMTSFSRFCWEVVIGPSVGLECVPKFCYLGDALGVRGVGAAEAGVGCAWAGFGSCLLSWRLGVRRAT